MDTVLSRFADIIGSASENDLIADPTLGGRLILAQDGRFTVAFAPFDHVNTSARVVIVGITPGRRQASDALVAARRLLLSGDDLAAASKAAKETASFAGPMRANLVAMLDHVGLQRRLGIATCADLFGARRDLVHYTSALRHPVFVDGANYAGDAQIVTRPILRAQVETHLANEARALPDALWLPLGPHPARALALLVRMGLLKQGQVLDGLPHPSGANGERIAYFLGRKAREALSAKTDAGSLDISLTSLKQRVAAF
jgi:hypothetical protein